MVFKTFVASSVNNGLPKISLNLRKLGKKMSLKLRSNLVITQVKYYSKIPPLSETFETSGAFRKRQKKAWYGTLNVASLVFTSTL